jgi:hypothetical protein
MVEVKIGLNDITYVLNDEAKALLKAVADELTAMRQAVFAVREGLYKITSSPETLPDVLQSFETVRTKYNAAVELLSDPSTSGYCFRYVVSGASSPTGLGCRLELVEACVNRGDSIWSDHLADRTFDEITHLAESVRVSRAFLNSLKGTVDF